MKKLMTVILMVAGLSAMVLAEQKTKYETAEAVVGSDGIQRLEIRAGSYFFKPNYIIVKAGIPVELTVKKEPGIAPHNIVLTMEGTDVKIRQDISTEGTLVRFTPAKPGKFPFYCDKKFLFFASHRERGMEGVVEVRE